MFPRFGSYSWVLCPGCLADRVVHGGEGWKSVNVKGDRAGTAFRSETGSGASFAAGGNQLREGDRSFVGHFRGYSRLRACYYRNRGHRGWLLEGLLDDWPGDEG